MKRTWILALTIPVIWVLFHFLSDGAVLTPGNMVNLFKYLTVVGILAIGMTFVIAAGHIDLSVGSGLGLLGAANAFFIYHFHWPLILALFVSLILALLMGFLHGSLVAYMRVPAFIVTLSGLMAYMGLKQFIANPVIAIENSTLLYLGQGYLSAWQGYFVVGIFSLGLLLVTRKNGLRTLCLSILALVFVSICNLDRGLPVCVLVMVLAAILGHALAIRTRFGRHVFAMGSNPDAAKYAGLSIPFLTLGVFIVLAVMTWLAGLVATSQLMAAAADIGDYQELYAIAACVIGGTSLRGGSGNVWMALLGALLMASILNGMEQMGIASTLQKVILGVILTASVAVDQVFEKKGRLNS